VGVSKKNPPGFFGYVPGCLNPGWKADEQVKSYTNSLYTVSQKTVKKCFCHKFVKCPPNLIIFGTQIAQRIGLCEVHRFSTSPN